MERLAQLNQRLTSSAPEQAVTITYEGEDKEIAVIAMSYASNMNALNQVMRTGLVEAFRTVAKQSHVKVICLRSDLPKVFCAGANIKEIVELTHEKNINFDIFQDICQVINVIRKPIIAAVNKLALGGGLELALLCDIMICSDDAKLGLPEIKIGVMPGMGGTLISKIIGKSNAMKMILSGEPWDAKRAYELGIVSEVTKPEDLHKRQIELAKQIAQYSLYSLATAKTAVKFSHENPSGPGLDFERRTFDGLLNLPGAREGLPAFVAKRKPDYRGK